MSKKTWGFVESQDGFKVTNKDDTHVVLAGGNTAQTSVNLDTSGGQIKIIVNDFTYVGGETIPSDGSMFTYVTFEGNSTQLINLPIIPIVGMRIMIMNPTINEIDIRTASGNIYKISGTNSAYFYYNRSGNWIVSDFSFCTAIL